MSIRDRIASIGHAMATGDHSPAMTRTNEIQLAGLMAHINRVVTASEIAYKRKLVELRKDCKSAADAKLFGEATEEYKDWRESLATKDSCEAMLRALSNASYSINAEMKMGSR